MNPKMIKERGWKRVLSFMLVLIMAFTLLPMGSLPAYADDEGSSSSPSEADYDIKYSEIRENGNGKAYPVGIRILMDIMPKSGTPKEEDAAGFCVDSLETAVFYGYITVDDSIDDSAREYYNSLKNELNKVIELKEWYYDYSGKHTIKSGGYWIFNKNNEKGSGDEFYGVVASSEKEGYKDVKVPKNKLDIVGSPKHAHQWNYTLSEDGKTITANCTNTDGNCEYRDTTALTYSIEAGNKTYSGNAYDGVSMTDNLTSITGDKADTKYYLADGTTLTTAENSGAVADGGAPVNAGKYVVKTTIGEVTASAGFEIKEVVGSGTEADPYIISSTAELKEMINSNVDTSSKYYKLSDDFDNTYVLTESLSQFLGNLNGNGKTINVNIDNTSNGKYTGLFEVNKGQISNLNIAGKIQGNSYPTGGICAFNYSGVISNCNNYAEIIGNENVGGICGNNYYSDGEFLQCTNYGNISGEKYVGGICGENVGSIKNCENKGTVTATEHYAEGIVGKNGTSSKDASVENCKNYGNVTCEPYKEYVGYDNSRMAYKEDDGSYSVIGKVGNAWHQIHFWDGSIKSQTNNEQLSVSLAPEIISDGKVLKFTVSIKNSASDTISDAKVTVYGDTELSGCDRSTNRTNDSRSIMTMSYNGISFIAFSQDTGFRIVNTAYGIHGIDAPQVNEKCDSAYSAQWNIDSIAGNETVTRTFYMECVEGENLSDADLNKIVNSAVHTHDWKYSVSGKKLEAYCAAEGCASETSETEKKTFTIAAADSTYSGHAYDGLNSIVAEISDFTGQTPSVIYTGRGNTSYAESETAPTNAGTYTAKVSIGDKTISTDFTINKRVAEITWSKNPTYNGNEQTVTATVSNAVDGDNFNIICTGNSGTNVGDSYTAKVTDLGNDNYTLEGSKNAEQKWSIDYLKTDAKVNIADEADGTNGWYKKDVTVNAPAGFTISEDGKTWTDSLSYNEDGQYTKGYYLKNSDGYIAKQELTFKIDKTAPTGSVKVGENTFYKLLNEITFGYFFKDYVEISITGKDTASGIAKVEYQMVGKNESYNPDGQWTSGETLRVTAGQKSAIYVRLTDEAGNQSVINTEGIVVYEDATPSDALNYTRLSDCDAVSTIDLKGNTVKAIKCGDQTLTQGTDYVIDGNKIVFKNTYLTKLAAGNYELTVSYNPAGEKFTEGTSHGDCAADSKISLTVNKISSEASATKITNADKLSKTYNGQQIAKVEISSKRTGTPKVEYKKKGASDDKYSSAVPTDAGEYTVRVTYPEDENYAESKVTSDFKISPVQVKLTWSTDGLIYNGQAQNVTATVSNAFEGDKFDIKYESNADAAVGKYTTTVTDLGNSNYTLEGADVTGLTKEWSISYLEIDKNAEPKLGGTTKNDSGWYTSDVTLTPGSGYKISTDGSDWKDSIDITKDGVNEITYYLKDNDGYITDKKTVTVKKDTTAPTAAIKIGKNSFKSFIDKITFGLFFKDTVHVAVDGEDTASGIAKIEYQKVAKDAKYDENGSWAEFKAFDINANDKSVIYVRVTDEAGNQIIVNSDGIVVYKDVMIESGTIDYTRTTGADVTSDIKLNGNTVKEIKNGDIILTEGRDYEVKDGKVVIKGAYLDTLPAGDHKLTVSYNPAGETFEAGTDATASTLTVSVSRADVSKAATTITNTDKLSKTYDGKPAAKVESSSNSIGTPKIEYKKKGASDDTYSSTVPTDAGEYTVRVTYPEDENYVETKAEADFTISRLNAEIKVNDASKHIGKADPEYAYSVTGLVGTDTLSGISVSREAGEKAGEYKIMASVDVDANPNYDVKVVNGILTIEDHVKAENMVIENRVEPTCTVDGSYDEVYYCTVDDCKAELERVHQTILAIGHKYGKPVFTWNDNKVTATFTCENDETHVETVDAMVTTETIDATCTEAGEKAYNAVVQFEGNVYTDSKTVEIPATGHKWSDWKVTKEASATEEGKKESTCTVCGHKKYDVIPATGTPEEDPATGTFEKEVQVSQDAPLDETTMTNSKSEFLKADNIFNKKEKEKIEKGDVNAKVWLEISKTDESKIASDVKAKVESKAKEITGSDASNLTYFDADLFKQISDTDGNIITPKTAISEPGTAIDVTFKIPDAIRVTEIGSTARVYKLIRIHTNADGTVSVDEVDGTYNEETGEFSTSTDKFSTYAIVYSDVSVTASFPQDDNADKPLTSVGEKRQLTVDITPASASTRQVKWTSSNPSVATVNENGIVTAVADGTATITATVGENGPTAEYTIKVAIVKVDPKPSGDKPSGNKPATGDTSDPNGGNQPASQPIAPAAKADAKQSDVKKADTTKKNATKTGDNNTAWPFVVVMFAGVTLATFGRKKKENR